MRFSMSPRGAVDLLVELLRRGVLGAQRGDDKARIGRASGPFRLGHNAALAAPAVARRPLGFLEPASGLAAGFAVFLGRGELAGETLVLGQAKQEIDAIRLAPTHQRLAGKPRIGAPPPRPRRLRRRCWRAAVWPPADANRRRCTAADSSSSRNSRERSGLPGARAADR